MGTTSTPTTPALPAPIVIAVAGRKHAGKTTVADMIIRAAEADGFAVMQRGCSELVAREVSQHIAHKVGINTEQAYRLLLGVGKEAYRPLLQWWGGEYRRGQCGDDYWLSRMADEIDRFAAAEAHAAGRPALFIMAGIRYRNEADWVRAQGGYVLRVERPGLPHYDDNHSTERDLDDYAGYHARIMNQRALEHLDADVARLWESMRRREPLAASV